MLVSCLRSSVVAAARRVEETDAWMRVLELVGWMYRGYATAVKFGGLR